MAHAPYTIAVHDSARPGPGARHTQCTVHSGPAAGGGRSVYSASARHTFSRARECAVSARHTFSRIRECAVSARHTFSRIRECAVSARHTFSRIRECAVSARHTFSRIRECAVSSTPVTCHHGGCDARDYGGATTCGGDAAIGGRGAEFGE